MSYATDDFTESLHRVDVKREDIARVVAAWGWGSGMGENHGHHRWAEDSASDWSGGFLCEMKDGSYVYITGWCDYTGWGCQDGAQVYRYTERPAFAQLAADVKLAGDYSETPNDSEWDIDPADLNRWLAREVANG